MQPLAAPSSRRRSDAEIIARAHRSDRSFAVLGLGVLVLTMIVLLSLIVDFMVDGLGRIDLDFLTSFPSRRAADAGILSAWVGTTLVMPVTTALAVPLGVAAGLNLEEHAPSNWITHLIEINVTNLAGVPSIIHGLLALGLFVQTFAMGQTILVAGMTLALLILPIIIVATREAVRSIPIGIREGACSDPPPFLWTPMLAFASFRGVFDGHTAPGVSRGVQAGGG